MNSKYKKLTNLAFLCHQEGNLDKAEEIYRGLLEIEPDDANILNLMGLLMISKGENDSAIDYLTKSFIISRNSGVASNLAKAYYTAGMIEKSIKLYIEALKIEPTDDIYYSLGISYKKKGDLKAAIEAYLNALDMNQENYSACYNLALAYNDIGDVAHAIFYGEKAAKLNIQDEAILSALSGFYEKIEDYESSIKTLKAAIKLNPDNYLYYYNIAVLSTLLNKETEAIEYYFKAISINPNNIESYVNLASLLKKRDENKALELLNIAYKINPKDENVLLNFAQIYKNTYKNDESIKILKELMLANPLCSEAYNLMAINLMDLGEYNEALKNYDIAIRLEPENLNFQHGKAVALKYLGKLQQCKEILESIVNNKEASTETKITLGQMYLQEKEFEKGMCLYRLRSEKLNKSNIWKIGENIENKTVLVYSDCGLGDSIMFSRYLPSLAKEAKKVILQTDRELINIFQESFRNIGIIPKSFEIQSGSYDIFMPFMDIMLALGVDFSNIPFSSGYLNTSKDFSNLPVFSAKKKKIGLFWQGNRRIFKNRSVDFDIINRLTENKECNFYSFQIGTKIKETDNFFDLSGYIKDYTDTAGLLKNMDLLITIDSSILHMAGALGVKTYLLLPKTAEWRWFNNTKTTPWYKSVTIFKQKKSNDWNEVMDRVEKSL